MILCLHLELRIVPLKGISFYCMDGIVGLVKGLGILVVRGGI